MGSPGDSVGKESIFNSGESASPGEGNGNPLQYSCLKIPMDRGAWWATVHEVAKSLTPLSTKVCWKPLDLIWLQQLRTPWCLLRFSQTADKRFMLCAGCGSGTAGSVHQAVRGKTGLQLAPKLGGIGEWQAENQVCDHSGCHHPWPGVSFFFFFLFFQFYFIFKLYIIVLVLPNIKMNPPQVYMCSPSWGWVYRALYSSHLFKCKILI